MLSAALRLAVKQPWEKELCRRHTKPRDNIGYGQPAPRSGGSCPCFDKGFECRKVVLFRTLKEMRWSGHSSPTCRGRGLLPVYDE